MDTPLYPYLPWLPVILEMVLQILQPLVMKLLIREKYASSEAITVLKPKIITCGPIMDVDIRAIY